MEDLGFQVLHTREGKIAEFGRENLQNFWERKMKRQAW